jgi:hypothetical protein
MGRLRLEDHRRALGPVRTDAHNPCPPLLTTASARLSAPERFWDNMANVSAPG